MCKITWCASLEPVFESPAHTLKVGCVCKCTGFQHWVVSTDKGRLLRFVSCRSSSVRGPAAREQDKVVEPGSLPPALCLHAHRVSWLVCTSPRHKQESSWKREPQLRKKCLPTPTRLACGQTCGTYSWWRIYFGGHNWCGWCHPKLSVYKKNNKTG